MTEAQKAAQKRYDKLNRRKFTINLNYNTDADLIAFIESWDNIQKGFKELLWREIGRISRGIFNLRRYHMIYYFHQVENDKPILRLITDNMRLELNVSLWFPTTKSKLAVLLKLLNEYDYEGKLPEILIQLSDDLKSHQTFRDREVKSTKMFIKMLNSNIEQIRIFGGKL